MAEHTWKRAGGEVDQFALDFEFDGTGHNGPQCSVCELSFCMHCAPEGWTIPCPGPAPEGDEWDWTGDGAGHPPREPELWSAI